MLFCACFEVKDDLCIADSCSQSNMDLQHWVWESATWVHSVGFGNQTNEIENL